MIGTEAMGEWGWRLIFLMAVPMGIVAFFIRDHLSESPEFQQMRAEKKGQTIQEGTFIDALVVDTDGHDLVAQPL